MKSINVIAAPLALLWMPIASAASYSDAELLQNGKAAWDKEECVKAARYLFAYQLRDPPALRANNELRNNIDTAISWCERNARIAAGVDSKSDDLTSGGAQSRPQRPQVTLNAPSSPGGNLDARRCDIYASIAVAQNEANRRNFCRMPAEARWSSEFDGHYGWCMNVPKAQSDAETVARQNLLGRCVTPSTPGGQVVAPVAPIVNGH